MKLYSKKTVAPMRSENGSLRLNSTLVDAPISPVRTHLLMAIICLVSISLLASAFFQIDVYATARGRTQPIGRSKVVQSLYPGRVLKINVQNGARVHAGDVLIELSPDESESHARELQATSDSYESEIVRRRMELQAVQSGQLGNPPALNLPPSIPTAIAARENASFRADLADLKASVDLLNVKVQEAQSDVLSVQATLTAQASLIGTVRERVAMRKTLEAKGFASHTQVIDALEDSDKEQTVLAQEQAELNQKKGLVLDTKAQIATTVANFISKDTDQLSSVEQKLDGVRQDLKSAEFVLHQTKIVAPIDGVVQQLNVTTIGQVLSTGSQLMAIVPGHAKIQIEALVENGDIGFVNVGQEAIVKVDAFPYTKYGTLRATIVRVSPDAVDRNEATAEQSTSASQVDAQGSAAAAVSHVNNLVYPVDLAIRSPVLSASGGRYAVSSGMDVTADIKTSRRTLLEYIFSPIAETVTSSGHER